MPIFKLAQKPLNYTVKYQESLSMSFVRICIVIWDNVKKIAICILCCVLFYIFFIFQFGYVSDQFDMPRIVPCCLFTRKILYYGLISILLTYSI